MPSIIEKLVALRYRNQSSVPTHNKEDQVKIIAYWKQRGVRFHNPDTVYIDPNVTIEPGTVIENNVYLINGSKIGNNCTIKSGSCIDNTQVEDNVIIHSHSVIENSHIKNEAQIGPFAHVHTESTIGTGTIIGNFVEISRSTVGENNKVKHHTYFGRTTTGSNVNIGAGTITCNYDGKNKHETTIEDDVFIGSNNTLVAPVTVGKGAYTAAGSTIPNDVPPGSVAFGRARQVNKEEYAQKLRAKL